MLKYMAYVFAIVFILLGVAGYMGFFMKDGLLLGLFAVNSWHNLIHVASGVVAGIAGFLGSYWSMRYFQVFGIVYGLVALMGLYYGDGLMMGVIANNYWDVGLHAVISAVALYLGFGCCCMCKSKQVP